MKNNSKNNYSEKNSNKNKRRKESKNLSKSAYFSNDEFSPKSNSYERKISNNKNELNKFSSKEKKVNNYPYSKGRNLPKGSNQELTYRKDNNKLFANKKNFDEWIWGKHPVYAALTSNRAINRIWCTAEIFSSEKFYILLKGLRLKGVLIEEVSWNRLSQLTFGATHQGVAMQLAHTESISLSKLIDLSKLNSANPIILALDGITDPHNLGAIIRSAEAFDCKGIILPQRRSAGLTGTVAKVAVGALEHLPVSRVVNLNRALEELKRNGFIIIGMTGEGQLSISKYNEKTPLVVVIGAEDKGISLLTQKKCDFLLTIPLKGKTSSLNASVAAAIALFHLTNR